MEKFCKDLLEGLLNKYQKSILSKNGAKRNILIKFKISDEIFKDYKDYRKMDNIETQLKMCEDKKFINIKKDRNDNIVSVLLNVEEIDAIYEFLGVKNPATILSEFIIHLKAYKIRAIGFTKSFIDDEINYIQNNFNFHKQLYNDVSQLDNLLNCLNAIQNIQEETMERDFSVKLFNDSKVFATQYKSKIINIIKKYENTLKELTDDEVLKEFNLVKNSSYVLIKYNLNFKINNQVIKLNDFGFEFSLSDDMINKMEILPSEFESIITVENLTTFKKISIEKAVVMFLSGFSSHTKQLLLNKIFNMYPNKKYYHFGDIDVGGFRIFNHLTKSTKIPFMPYKMSVNELKLHKEHLKPLSENDVRNLLLMKHDTQYDLFQKEIDFMLKNNVKLEQEILD